MARGLGSKLQAEGFEWDIKSDSRSIMIIFTVLFTYLHL
jgi:hypothetical protein